MAGHVRVDGDRYIHDTIDGETVIIDTVAGRLTLLVGVGSAIWTRLLAGAQPPTVVEEVGDVYGSVAADECSSFMDALCAAGLVIEAHEPVQAATSADPPPAVELPWPTTYEQPGIEQYDDIADIMTMDPIHEVDAGLGWPHRGS